MHHPERYSLVNLLPRYSHSIYWLKWRPFLGNGYVLYKISHLINAGTCCHRTFEISHNRNWPISHRKNALDLQQWKVYENKESISTFPIGRNDPKRRVSMKNFYGITIYFTAFSSQEYHISANRKIIFLINTRSIFEISSRFYANLYIQLIFFFQ